MVEKDGFVVSTDSSGVLGTPKVWRQLWGFAQEDSRFLGFEMIAWGGRLSFWPDYLFSQAKKLGCQIKGIHGRLGGLDDVGSLSDRVMSRLVNALLTPTPALVTRFAQHCDYIVLHAPELRTEANQTVFKKEASKVNLLFVENHVRPGSVGATLEIARELAGEGLKTGVVFDLVHYMRTYRGTCHLGQWQRAVKAFDWVLEEMGRERTPLMFHLSLGTDLSDSLPFEQMTEPMWQDLAQRRREGNFLLGIENKVAGYPFFLPPSARAKEVDRNRRIIDKLIEQKLI